MHINLVYRHARRHLVYLRLSHYSYCSLTALAKMGSIAEYPEWKQISLTSASCDGIPVAIDRIDSEARSQEEERFRTALINSASEPSRRSIRISPYPILFPDRLIIILENFQEALNLAVLNIVDRWFESDDSEKALFRRMPLQPHEDALLRVSYGLLTLCFDCISDLTICSGYTKALKMAS